MFRKLDVLLSIGEEEKTPNLLEPLERVKLNRWTRGSVYYFKFT
jgi:hypothetical protein